MSHLTFVERRASWRGVKWDVPICSGVRPSVNSSLTLVDYSDSCRHYQCNFTENKTEVENKLFLNKWTEGRMVRCGKHELHEATGGIIWYVDLQSIFWRNGKSSHRDTCIPMFIGVLFTIAKLWTPPRWQWTEEWIKEMWYYVYMMVYYLAGN